MKKKATPLRQVRMDIRTVVKYLWRDEERHYEESPTVHKRMHIYHTLKRLKAWAK